MTKIVSGQTPAATEENPEPKEKYTDYDYTYTTQTYTDTVTTTSTATDGDTTTTTTNTKDFSKTVITELYTSSGKMILWADYDSETGEVSAYYENSNIDTETGEATAKQIHTEEWR